VSKVSYRTILPAVRAWRDGDIPKADQEIPCLRRESRATGPLYGLE
jgi:hypothetical protein